MAAGEWTVNAYTEDGYKWLNGKQPVDASAAVRWPETATSCVVRGGTFLDRDRELQGVQGLGVPVPQELLPDLVGPLQVFAGAGCVTDVEIGPPEGEADLGLDGWHPGKRDLDLLRGPAANALRLCLSIRRVIGEKLEFNACDYFESSSVYLKSQCDAPCMIV